MSSTKSISSALKSCFCNVCFDAGKSELEYTSHYVRASREPNAKVVCPTLNALECNYCFKKGHTVKYCDVLKKQDKMKKTQERESKKVFANAKAQEEDILNKKSKKTVNAFDALGDSSDSEREEQTKTRGKVMQEKVKKDAVEDFPCLPTKQVVIARPVALAYGNIVTKARQQEQLNKDKKEKQEQQDKKQQDKKQQEVVTKPSFIQVAEPFPVTTYRRLLGQSWADMCDSSSSDEEELNLDSDSDDDNW